ncbi:2954_t:CDS:2, partial [Paraglomus occultum]
KRKAEFNETRIPKRRFLVNSAITRGERSICYFVDLKEQNKLLLKRIQAGEFIALHGPRASGKSTQALMIQEQLQEEGFICIYASFEQVNIRDGTDVFWQTLGKALQRDATEFLGPLEHLKIKTASDFLDMFHRTKWKFSDAVLILDEFDTLYNATEDVLNSCLTTFRSIKSKKDDYFIHSMVAIGPFSILYIDSKRLTTSPFNVKTPFQNQNFTLDQVHTLYNEFTEEYALIIDLQVIEDVFMQTNGYAISKSELLETILT